MSDATTAGDVGAASAPAGPGSPDPGEGERDFAGAQQAAVLLARIARAHAEGRPFAFSRELDGADPAGRPIFGGVTLDWVELAGGGLLLVQRLEQTIAALLRMPVAGVAGWLVEEVADPGRPAAARAPARGVPADPQPLPTDGDKVQ